MEFSGIKSSVLKRDEKICNSLYKRDSETVAENICKVQNRLVMHPYKNPKKLREMFLKTFKGHKDCRLSINELLPIP